MSDKKPPCFLVAAPSQEVRNALLSVFEKIGIKERREAANLADAQKILGAEDIDFLFVHLDIIRHENPRLIEHLAHPEGRTRPLPILAVIPDDGEASLMDEARRIGVSQFVSPNAEPAVFKEKIKLAIADMRAKVQKGQPASAPQSGPQSQAEAKSVQIGLARAGQFLQDGNQRKAAEEFAAVLKTDKTNEQAYFGLGQTLRGMGDQERGNAYMAKGVECLIAKGNMEEAEAKYKELGADDDSLNPFLSMGRRLYDNKHYERAIQVLKAGVELSPENEDIHLILSDTYLKLGRKDEALDAVKSILGDKGESLAAQTAFFNLTGKEWSVEEGEAGIIQVLDDEPSGQDQAKVERRRSLRVPLADFFVVMKKHPEEFPVVDMSLTGLSFKCLNLRPESGQQIEFNLITPEEVKFKKLKAQVRHVTDGVAGCKFLNVNDKLRKRFESFLMAQKKTTEDLVLDDKKDFNIGNVGMW